MAGVSQSVSLSTTPLSSHLGLISCLTLTQVSKWCGVFAGIGGGAVVMGVLQQYGFACMGQHLTRRLRALLLSSMLRQVRCCRAS